MGLKRMAKKPRENRRPAPAARAPHPGPTGEGAAPPDLPADAAEFWSAPAEAGELSPPADGETTPALKKLGPMPFPRGPFPLMGFLATVYEQVAARAREALAEGDEPPAKA
jgi:hypothetical protein